MRSRRTRWLTLAIALCFAFLQALQPFIHGHLDLDHPIHKIGFHLNENNEEHDHSAVHHNAPAITDAHVSHTIVVASGIKQDVDLTLLANLSIALFFWYLATVLLNAQGFYPQSAPIHDSSLKRRHQTPRAPPHF